jgi:formate-dependent nitrite reductase membrane component NrfD
VSTPEPTEPFATVTSDEVRVRRAPRMGAFLVVGALVGFIVTLILTTSFPTDENVGFLPMLAYFSCFGVAGGVVLGALVAIILDRASSRHTRSAVAERTSVEEPPVEGQLED